MSISRAIIAAPPVRDFYFTPGRASALGAASVKKALHLCGIDSEIINFPLLNARGTTIALPEHYDYLKPYLLEGERGPLAFFSKRKIYGPSFLQAANAILKRKPQILFISLFAWTYGEDAIALAEEVIKQSKNKLPIILGGAGASVYPEFYRETGLFDLVITGEAETQIPALINHIHHNNDLEDFKEEPALVESPAPVLSFREDSKGQQFLTLCLSRGCPKRCRFCSNFLTQGRKLRLADLEQLEDELSRLSIDSEKNIHINLEDDNLLFNKRYFNDFLALMRKLFPDKSITVENGLDYTLLSTEMINHLIEEGFSHFSLSLGSADFNVLSSEKRPADLEKLELILDHLQEKQIPTTTFFIAGLPDDRWESVIDTLSYVHKLPTRSGVSPFYAVPGLPRFEDLEVFHNTPPSLCSGSSLYPWSRSLTTKQLATIFRLSRFSNLLKKSQHSSEETQLIETIFKTGDLYTFIGKTKNLSPVPAMDKQMIDRFIQNIS